MNTTLFHLCVYFKIFFQMEISEKQRKYVRFAYTQENLEDAINDILTRKLTLNAASVTYKIPKSTLHNKINHKVPLVRQMNGSQT